MVVAMVVITSGSLQSKSTLRDTKSLDVNEIGVGKSLTYLEIAEKDAGCCTLAGVSFLIVIHAVSTSLNSK